MGIVREWVDKSRSEDSRDNSEKYDIHYVNVECSDLDLVVVCFITSSFVYQYDGSACCRKSISCCCSFCERKKS